MCLIGCAGPPTLECEGFSGLAPRRYCKEDIIRVQRLLESRVYSTML
jgi:hypothetical protein